MCDNAAGWSGAFVLAAPPPTRRSTRLALLGVQIEFVQKQLFSFMPADAILSMLGVLLIRLPYAEMAWAA